VRGGMQKENTGEGACGSNKKGDQDQETKKRPPGFAASYGHN